jgi:hypothetical protein
VAPRAVLDAVVKRKILSPTHYYYYYYYYCSSSNNKDKLKVNLSLYRTKHHTRKTD